MFSENIKALYEYIELKEYKLSYFISELRIPSIDNLSQFGYENIKNNTC